MYEHGLVLQYFRSFMSFGKDLFMKIGQNRILDLFLSFVAVLN